MNNTQHTPGPTCTCGVITTVIETGIGCYDENEIAQCPLCKSAPAMYEALSRLRNVASTASNHMRLSGNEEEALLFDNDQRVVEAALAQAEGAQHE